MRRVVGGLVVACLGDPAPLSYKKSRRGDAHVDQAAAHVVEVSPGVVAYFVPWGWDERQFNSPGFDLPIGCLTRSIEGEFREYHASADDLGLLDAGQLEGALEAALAIFDVVESDRRFVNLQPKGEPQLGRRGLYCGLGGNDPSVRQRPDRVASQPIRGMRRLVEIPRDPGRFPDLSIVAGLAEAGLLEPRSGRRLIQLEALCSRPSNGERARSAPKTPTFTDGHGPIWMICPETMALPRTSDTYRACRSASASTGACRP